MKQMTLEKVLWFVGRLIRALFLIAWNLTRVTAVLFLALLGGAPKGGLEPVHLRELSLRQEDWPYHHDQRKN